MLSRRPYGLRHRVASGMTVGRAGLGNGGYERRQHVRQAPGPILRAMPHTPPHVSIARPADRRIDLDQSAGFPFGCLSIGALAASGASQGLGGICGMRPAPRCRWVIRQVQATGPVARTGREIDRPPADRATSDRDRRTHRRRCGGARRDRQGHGFNNLDLIGTRRLRQGGITSKSECPANRPVWGADVDGAAFDVPRSACWTASANSAGARWCRTAA
jgi:hypothetical protein